MECEQVKRLLSPFMDGELPKEIREKMAGHVESCPACARELKVLELQDATLLSLPVPESAPLTVTDVLGNQKIVNTEDGIWSFFEVLFGMPKTGGKHTHPLMAAFADTPPELLGMAYLRLIGQE